MKVRCIVVLLLLSGCSPSAYGSSSEFQTICVAYGQQPYNVASLRIWPARVEERGAVCHIEDVPAEQERKQ